MQSKGRFIDTELPKDSLNAEILYYIKKWENIATEVGTYTITMRTFAKFVVSGILTFCLRGDVLSDSLADKTPIPKKPQLGFQSAAAAAQRNLVVSAARRIATELSLPEFLVYGLPSGEKANAIVFYQIFDENAWRRISERMTEEKKRHGWRKIYIEFRDKQVWIERPNGTRVLGGSRLLKSVLIE